MVQNYLLELEGKLAGRLFSVDGGFAREAIVDEPIGPHNERIKHVTTVDVTPILLACGTGMSHKFYDWIGRSFNNGSTRMSGSVITLDQDSKPVRRLEFFDALIVRLVLPALDKSQKEDAVLKVTIQPEQTRTPQRVEPLKLGVYTSNLAKAWYINSFRFQIDGLSRESEHVTHIRGILLKRGIKSMYTGASRYPQIEPTSVEFPNVSIELPAAHGDGFTKWLSDSVKAGTSAQPKKGSIEFLAPASGSSFFGLDLNGAEIQSVSPQSLRTLKIDIYCKSMVFRAGPAAIK